MSNLMRNSIWFGCATILIDVPADTCWKAQRCSTNGTKRKTLTKFDLQYRKLFHDLDTVQKRVVKCNLHNIQLHATEIVMIYITISGSLPPSTIAQRVITSLSCWRHQFRKVTERRKMVSNTNHSNRNSQS
jgi:hypothetical protein